MSRWYIWLVRGLLGFFLLACLIPIGLALPLDFVIALSFGWVWYLGRVLPEVTISWAGIVTALVCLVGFAVGLHVLLRGLYDQTNEPIPRMWPTRWTAAFVALVLLMFVSGIAATGVVHQLGWILTSQEPMTQSASVAWDRSLSVNNLKQIYIGLHQYHEQSATFPPGGTFDGSGRGLHGWQTMLLPFIDRQPLYQQIDLSLPWNDPRHASVFETEIGNFLYNRVPDRTDPEGRALSHYAGNSRVLNGDAPWSIPMIVDGTSNTILAGEVAGEFKPWGHPANWRDPALGINRTTKGFGSRFPGGANFLFADGSVHFLRDTIDPNVMKALSTPDGGETIEPGNY